MPIFGKESPVRRRRRLAGSTEKFVDTVAGREIRGGKSARVFVKATSKVGRHTQENTPKKMVEKEFRLLFPNSGKDFIERRFEETGRPVVVLDWGCGSGVAIRQFADKYGNHIHPYGFGKDYYAAWGHGGKVSFIQATAKDLLKQLKKIGPIDLIYSNIGLMWLFPLEGTPREEIANKIKEEVNYIEKLTNFVSPKGKIAFNLPLHNNQRIVQELKNQFRGKANVKRDRFQVYITKLPREKH